MQPDLRPVEIEPRGALPAAAASESLQHRVLRNTYWLLALSLIPTTIGAVAGTAMDWSFMRASPMISFFLVLAVFYGWMFAIERNRNSGLGVGLLLGFTFFLGLLLGPLLQRTLGLSNGGQLVMMAAGGTAVVFFVLASVASSTKRDFSKLGSFLTVGGIVLLLAMVANAFIASSGMYLAIVSAFVLFSSLLIMWQVNNIVRGGETNYISATLTLYIAIYNLFSSLLQLLGIFGGSRD